jgi:hypothetical protein
MKLFKIIHTLWLFNIAMENGPFIDDVPINTSIYKGFSMVMLNNQRVPLNQRFPNKLVSRGNLKETLGTRG